MHFFVVFKLIEVLTGKMVKEWEILKISAEERNRVSTVG